MNNSNIKTKKAAQEAGYRTREQWLSAERTFNGGFRRPMVPRRGARPIFVKSTAYYAFDQCEELISKTEATRRGLRVPSSLVPVKEQHIHAHGKSLWYALYRLSDCRQQRRRRIPPREVDLLEAISVVNESRKRYQRAADEHHEAGHGLPLMAAEAKAQRLGELKHTGIIAAWRSRRLRFYGWHGNLAVYGGEGFIFHSHVVPEAFADSPRDAMPAIVMASLRAAPPRIRLKDAEHTLEQLIVDIAGFTSVDERTGGSRRKSLSSIVGEPSDLNDDCDVDDNEFRLSEMDDGLAL